MLTKACYRDNKSLNKQPLLLYHQIMHQTAIEIVRRLQQAGFIAYFAGGWVRDFLMQRSSDDIDIATSASVSDIQALFTKTVPVGVAFGIVIVVENGMQFEVATFRKDRGYIDGRRPTGIDPATPQEDALRRDFTINGLFYDPLTDTLYDYVGGRLDIETRLIRAIGDPHARFAEDRLRMMRAVRYATRFGFRIDPETEAAIRVHASELIPAVAMERVWQEFKKMSQFSHFDAGLIQLHRLGLLPTIFPALKGESTDQISQKVGAIPDFPPGSPPFAELLELFPSHSLQEIEELAEYLKLSKEESAFAHFYHHIQSLLNMPADWLENLERMEWAELYAHPFCKTALGMLAARLPKQDRASFLSAHENRAASLRVAIERIQNKSPLIRAEDLLKEGISPGPKMGKLLKEALRIAVNKGIEDKQELLRLLREHPEW